MCVITSERGMNLARGYLSRIFVTDIFWFVEKVNLIIVGGFI